MKFNILFFNEPIMKVLITGAGGYIGTILTDMLGAMGHSIVALDRFLFGDTLSGMDNVTLVNADIRTYSRLNLEKLLNDVDAVIDLAALSNDPSGELNPVNTISINHLGRFRVASLAKQAGVQKYILPSSCSIYGFNDEYVDEKSKPNPLTTYAKANLMIEEDSLALNSNSFSVTVFRLATVYGLSPRRMRFDLVVNDVVGQVFTKGLTNLTTGGTQWRPFVHVRDVCKGLSMGLDSQKNLGGETFNLGSNSQNYQIINVAKKIFDSLGMEEKYNWVGSPDKRSYKVKFDKISTALNFRPEWDIGEGAKEVMNALAQGLVKYGDDKTITVKWYKRLMDQGISI